MEEFYTFLGIVALLHCCLFFFDTFFKTCCHLPYLNLITSTGIQIKPFQIHWFTGAFNRIIQKWGSVRPKFLLAWFSAGSWVTVVLMPLAIALLLRSTYLIIVDIIREENSVFTNVGTLQPMMPGLNIPLYDMGYYMLTLLICTVIHELGHAVAAVREDGRVNGVGVVMAVCVPVAYVSLEGVEALPAARRLRVLCAGVWHNLVLALAAAAALAAMPYVLLPLYDWGTGARVVYVQPESPVQGVGGLHPRDLVVGVGECPVTDGASWQGCLARAARNPTPGYCLQSEFIKEHDESVPAKHLSVGTVECCGGNAARHLCFEYLDEKDSEPLQLPQFSCLNARTVVEHAVQLCYQPQDCREGLHCFRPSLENITKLVSVRTAASRVVLFLGHPAEVFHTVTVSDFVDLYAMFPPSIPDRIKLLCQYVASFSVGMALLNAVPCFYFDGQHITRTLLDLHLAKRVEHPSVRHAMALCLTFIGTFLLCLYLVMAVGSALT